MFNGYTEGIPYSLSRWTDISGDKSKWAWFEACLDAGRMVAFDPRTMAPGIWALTPNETLGLVFWTKNPKNLIQHRQRLDPYNVIVHMTVTGWWEVEKKAPTIFEAGYLLAEVSKIFKTYWRFSPIPLLPPEKLLPRFCKLLDYASLAHTDRVYVSFLQDNDLISETRSLQERFDLLNSMAEKAKPFGIKVLLCADDQNFNTWPKASFQTSACVQTTDFGKGMRSESCGCVLMVDPFTINEACELNCQYCYTADRALSPHKRNTTESPNSP